MRSIALFIGDEAGQDLIEYALLAAFISLAVVTSVTMIGNSLSAAYQSFSGDVDNIPR
jgi:pilus assembly protein Flp/PilA